MGDGATVQDMIKAEGGRRWLAELPLFIFPVDASSRDKPDLTSVAGWKMEASSSSRSSLQRQPTVAREPIT